MFDRFTDRAKKTMAFARQASQRLNHEYIAPEHMLLGLLREGDSVAVHVLKNLNVDVDKLREEAESRIRPGRTLVTMNQLPFTPRGKRVLELSMEEASQLSHNYIGTEHLLLGMIREGQSIAAQALKAFGLEIEKVREEVLDFLGTVRTDDATFSPAERSARFEKRLLEKLVAPVDLAIRTGLAYVALPPDPRGEQLLREAIAPTLAKLGLEAVRGADLGDPNTDLAAVWRQLCSAELVLIAANANASLSYLLGFCHGAQRCPILLVESGTELPRCLGALPRLDYAAEPQGMARLAAELERLLGEHRRARDSGRLP